MLTLNLLEASYVCVLFRIRFTCGNIYLNLFYVAEQWQYLFESVLCGGNIYVGAKLCSI